MWPRGSWNLFDYIISQLCLSFFFTFAVEPLYNTIYYARYHIQRDIDKFPYCPDFVLTKDTPYLALTGELWSVFCEYFSKKTTVLWSVSTVCFSVWSDIVHRGASLYCLSWHYSVGSDLVLFLNQSNKTVQLLFCVSEGEIWSMGDNSMGQLGRKVCKWLINFKKYTCLGNLTGYRSQITVTVIIVFPNISSK